MNQKKKLLHKTSEEQINFVSNLFSVLSNPQRVKILAVLKKRKRLNVHQIQEELHLSQSNVSQHLSTLKVNKLVHEERKGKEVYYSLMETKRISKVLVSASHLISYQLAVSSEFLSTYAEILPFWA